LLLLLQIICLCLLILALMQPFLQSGQDVAEYLPILVDCSASMGAVDEVTGQTRLDAVKEELREQIANLTGSQQMSLFSFTTTGRRLTEFTNDRQLLLQAVNRMEPSHLPGSLDDVLRQAWAFTQSFPVEKIVVFSDTNLPEKVEFELPFPLEIHRIPVGGANLGITELSARRSGAEEWDVFLRVAGSTTELRNAELQILQNGEPIAREQVEVGLDESERLIFPIAAAQSTLIEARVVPAGNDSLAVDNQAWITLPRPRPLTVWVSSQLPAWQHALSVIPGLTVDASAQPVAPEYDVLIIDEELPSDTQAGIQVFVGIIPPDLAMAAVESGTPSATAVPAAATSTPEVPENAPAVSVADGDNRAGTAAAAESDPDQGSEPESSGAVTASRPLLVIEEEISRVVDWNRTEPILRHVQLAELQLGVRPAYAPGVQVDDLEERGYEVLIDGNAGPLLLLRREGLQTSYYFTFHTDKSTLPFRVAFPVLVSNIIESGLKMASLNEVSAAPTGVLPLLQLDAEREYTITGPDGTSINSTTNESGVLSGLPAVHTGLYQVHDGSDLVTSVGTGLLNPLETSLSTVDEFSFTELKVAADETKDLESHQPLWWGLALVAFAVLLLEWWYFQRAKGLPA
ncbi:MAG: VWA domain-containing protein, partial [Planctomycetaceae bacterium]|nr:VWA domain-containing protein [Planctomycetaceae bacterium]